MVLLVYTRDIAHGSLQLYFIILLRINKDVAHI